ncbi:hypothetical protein [Roseovarius nitratireducens]|uniref:hypothetical protein n=1 Tax=Roseovarius nitratireducens TaxID=2044597 RepID=UPI000CE1E586|nr:hypothetical protein [Roseovarius nitratireducens]
MAQIRRYIVAGGSIFAALGYAYFMQAGAASPPGPARAAQVAQPVEISRIELTSAPALPLMPDPATLPDAQVTRAVARDIAVPGDLPSEERAPSFECEAEMTASVREAAIVRLDLEAPCHPNARVTLHHNGMMISALTDVDGGARIDLPALAESAVFIAAFEDGKGALATATIDDLALYDRFVVQWSGDARSLRLHALEYGADFGMPGHVWSEGTQAEAEGFVMRLGGDVPGPALRAEVYTFPTASATREGTVALRLEAEVTDGNCGRDVEAQGISTEGDGAALRVQDLVLPMPGCEATGEFLVLKNLFNDLNIAQK